MTMQALRKPFWDSYTVIFRKPNLAATKRESKRNNDGQN